MVSQYQCQKLFRICKYCLPLVQIWLVWGKEAHFYIGSRSSCSRHGRTFLVEPVWDKVLAIYALERHCVSKVINPDTTNDRRWSGDSGFDWEREAAFVIILIASSQENRSCPLMFTSNSLPCWTSWSLTSKKTFHEVRASSSNETVNWNLCHVLYIPGAFQERPNEVLPRNFLALANMLDTFLSFLHHQGGLLTTHAKDKWCAWCRVQYAHFTK